MVIALLFWGCEDALSVDTQKESCVPPLRVFSAFTITFCWSQLLTFCFYYGGLLGRPAVWRSLTLQIFLNLGLSVFKPGQSWANQDKLLPPDDADQPLHVRTINWPNPLVHLWTWECSETTRSLVDVRISKNLEEMLTRSLLLLAEP